MPIHRTRTLENLSASSFSFKESSTGPGLDTSKRAPVQSDTNLVTPHSTPHLSPSLTIAQDGSARPIKRRPLPGAQARAAQRSRRLVAPPLQSGLTMFFAETTLEPPVAKKAPTLLQPNKPTAAEGAALRKRARKVLHVNTKLPVLPGERAEGEEGEVEGILFGSSGTKKRRWLLDGKTPKGIKRRRSDSCTPSPEFQEEFKEASRTSLLEEISSEGGDTEEEPLQKAKEERQERPRKLLRLRGENGPIAVRPQLDVAKAPEPVLIYPGVHALEAAHFKGGKNAWTHIIHIEDCGEKGDHSNYRDEKDVHHLHLYTSPGSSLLSLKEAQLKTGRDFLSLALPYSCIQAEDSSSFVEPPFSWVDQRWETEPSRVVIVFSGERLRDVLALVATFGVFDGAGTIEELVEHFMDSFPESATADAARDIWEDWRAVEKLKRAGTVDMIKKPARKWKPVRNAPINEDEWE